MPRARLSLALLIAVTGPALAQQAPAPEPTTEGEAGLGSLLAPRRGGRRARRAARRCDRAR
ncbi:MAG: hypothetical protein OXT09_33850, partial [Myxococcales bacterium]|nr:hypothetical protein [Myxococcales bacterium]